MTTILHDPEVSGIDRIGACRPILGRLVRCSIRALVFFVLGAVLSILMAWALGLWADPETATVSTTSIPQRGRIWNISAWDSSGALRFHFQRQVHSWSGWQATGAPDSPMNGDSALAWCPATADSQPEWLVLDYPQAVIPKEVEIYENYDPGAVRRVTVFKENGDEIEAWRGEDPTPASNAAGISKIPVNLPIKTKRVKIYIDSQKVPGWNEIDAVGLVDETGNTQWASDVQDSSSYADLSTASLTSGPALAQVVPPWCPVTQSEQSSSDDRIFEARGWPMLALWSERETSSAAPNASTAPRGSAGRSLPRSPSGALPPVLPTRPIWWGLIFDSAFYGLFLAGAYWMLVKPRRLLLELLRMRRGCCIACGYELDFDFRSGCPECGWRRSAIADRP